MEEEVLNFPEMSAETALKLFEEGGVLVVEGLPPGSEFGIDHCSWTVGERFLGLKMIPPGLHFFCFSSVSKEGAQAPRIGFFHEFKGREILVKRWDRKIEDLSSETLSMEEMERYRGNLKELDRHLGPYPYQTLKTWFSLTNHVTPELVQSLSPPTGRISTQCELTTLEMETQGAQGSRVDREHPNRLRFVDDEGLPIMKIKDGHRFRFPPLPSRAAPKGYRGSALSEDSRDGSRRVSEYVEGRTEGSLLGELQFSFVLFLVGHVFYGFERWKHLLALLCSANKALAERGKLYEDLVMVLFYQLRHCPRDFFVDIVSKDNFLTTTLTELFQNAATNDAVSDSLKKKLAKFQKYLTRNYRWSFEPEPDQPMIVLQADV